MILTLRLTFFPLILASLVPVGLTSAAVAQRRGDPQTSTTSPKPSSDDDDDKKSSGLQNLLAGSRVEQERQLNERGPQVTATIRAGSFGMAAFVQAGWAIVAEYRLEDGAEANLEIVTLNERGLHIRRLKLEGVDIGSGVLRAVVTIPAEFGEKQPGSLNIIATKKDEKGRKQPAKFFLYSLGCGVSADFPGLFSAGRKHKDGTRGFTLASFRSTKPIPSDINITPELLDTAHGQQIEYRFVAPGDFGQWAAYFGVITNTEDGTEVKRVTERMFPVALARGSEAVGEWNGKNSKGKVKKGQYTIAVTAWWSAASAGAGASCVLRTDHTFTVQ